MGKQLRSLLCAIAILVGLMSLGGFGAYLYLKTYVNIDGTIYRREETRLDLSGQPLSDADRLIRFPHLEYLDLRQTGTSLEDILWLREQLPGCTILWELPFQGGYLSPDTRHIRVEFLTQEDVLLLDHLPQLASVDAWDCRDYGPLLQLQQRRPECKVFYNVIIGADAFDCDRTELVLADCDDPQLELKLRCMPRLEKVHFTGELPQAMALRSLQQSFPRITFSWKGRTQGISADSTQQELDLSGKKLNIVELDQLLTYYPGLKTLYLGDTGLDKLDLMTLERGYDGLLIVWNLEIAGVPVRRDARELDLSGIPIPDLPALEEQLALLPLLEKVIMCDCGFTSQEMHQLDLRHENIRFVWSVNLGGILLRTDATWFAPNKYYIEVDDAAIQDLQYCRDMVCIDIGHMRGVTHCSWAANMPGLKYLVIADTNITDLSPLAGLKELVFLEVFMSPVRDYSPLLQCPKLEDLNLGYTYGDAAPVMEMTWLHRLWWPGALWKLDWGTRNRLRTCLPDTKMNFVAGSSTGEGWRQSPNYYAMRDYMGMEYMTG